MIPAVVLVLGGAAVCAGAGPAVPSSFAQRIAAQEARLPQIETQAVQDQNQVEQWFQVRRAEVEREIPRQAAALLSLPQRELWVQYADLYLDRPYAPACFNAGFSDYWTAVVGNAMIQEYLISEMADLLVSREFEQKLEQIVGERLEAPWLRPLRDQAVDLLGLVKEVRARSATELKRLENQKQARLDAIMEWENDLKEQVRGILEYLRQRGSRPAEFGVVESVGYCPDSGYYCVVEGVDKALTVGDTVGAVRVRRIDREKVEFARDGTTWTQALGAPPRPFWEEAE